MAWMRWWKRRPRAEGGRDGRPADPSRRTIRGRRFVAGIPYVLPKDLQEVSRLDFQHYMLRFALRANFVAPLRDPHDILDVACGTGRWALEMAQTFPESNVAGLDVVPPPPDAGSGPDVRPPNYVFVQGNVLEGLPFANASFDYTHMRLMMAALPANRWQDVVNELVRVTRPGGWIELVEGDLLYNIGPALDKLNQWGIELCARRGIDLTNGSQIPTYLRASGINPVYTREVRLPVGSRGGRLGAMAVTDYLAILTSVRGFLISLGFTTDVEYDRLFAQAQTEIARRGHEWPFYIAYGQRP